MAPKNHFTDEMLEELKEMYPHTPNADLANRYNCSKMTVRRNARKLELKKANAYNSLNNTKICAKCGEEKSATVEFFYKQKRGLLGLHSRCKICENERSLKQYIDNPAKAREYKRNEYHRNKDKINKRNKFWSSNNRYKINIYKTEWRKEHPEKYENEQKANRLNQTIKRENLKDPYIKERLQQQFGIPRIEISQELIEAKRRQLKYSRHLRTLKQIANERRESIRSND